MNTLIHNRTATEVRMLQEASTRRAQQFYSDTVTSMFGLQTAVQFAGEDFRKVAEQHRLANMRAKKLLMSKLDEAQQREFLDTDRFTVKSKVCPNLTYTLSSNYTFNINIHLFGKPIGKFCVSVDRAREVPIYDMLLAQKLMLETDEERFIQTGNLGWEAF